MDQSQLLKGPIQTRLNLVHFWKDPFGFPSPLETRHMALIPRLCREFRTNVRARETHPSVKDM